MGGVERPIEDLVLVGHARSAEEMALRRPIRLLVVGSVDVAEDAAPEIRRAEQPPGAIPGGCYFFWIDGGWVGLLVAGDCDVERVSARHDRIEDSHPLAIARQWLDFLWPAAAPVGQRGAFEPGDVVRLLGSDAIGEITDQPSPVDDSFVYRVLVAGRVKTVTESGLERVDTGNDDPVGWVQGVRSSAQDVANRITLTKVTNALSDTLYSYGSSKTVLRSYQFKPVLRMIGSDHKRLLIADEVGLGKTIEAGLVWTELEQRSHVRRVLVVCPSMLVRKWRDEMQRRFGRTIRILDRLGLEELVEHIRSGDGESVFYGVVSLERLRSSDHLAMLESAGPTFDLVIVDEAHYLRNSETASYEVGERLSEWSDALIFLSATPLNLGQDDLFNLVSLLLPAQFPSRDIFPEQLEPNAVLTRAGRLLRDAAIDRAAIQQELEKLAEMRFGPAVVARPEYVEFTALLNRPELTAYDRARAKRLLGDLNTLASTVSRTRRADVPEAKAIREPITIHVDWSEAEQAFYQRIWLWTWARAKAKGIPPGFAAQMPLRQTASCIPAMLQRLAGEQQDAVDDAEDDLGAESGIDDASAWEDELVATLRAQLDDPQLIPQVDTKFDAFASALERARQLGTGQVMVFSFFRLTLEYLQLRLQDSYRVAVMHGGVDVAQREVIMERFRAGKIDILLLSEVGSEGLDFEFCNVLFNYDLPWNPMRVEQRIGRLDRFGQVNDKIFIFNFQVPGTIETDIFERLYARLKVFEDSIGELEPVLRSEFADLQRIAFDPRLSDDQRAAELRRTETAFAERAQQLDELRMAESELIGLDQLTVDGLESDLDRGRYIGREEIRVLVQRLLHRHPGSMLRLDDGASGTIIGTGDLAQLVSKTQRIARASRFSLTELCRLLADGEPIDVTLDPDVASRTDRDLLSLRHPLVLTAIEDAQNRPELRAARYARMRIRGNQPGRYLALLSLLEITGLRPTLELSPTTIDLDRLVTVDGVGDLLLGAIARGEIDEWQLESEPDLRDQTALARSVALRELVRIEAERRASNDALVTARRTTVTAEFEFKIGRAQATLAKVSDRPTLRRLHEGRIRNLRAEESRRLADIEHGRELSANLRDVAVVHLEVL
jgi:superfamily II DNA or RNA helicase